MSKNASGNKSIQKKGCLPVNIGGFLSQLDSIQSTINEAMGVATTFELLARIIAQLVPEVQLKLEEVQQNSKKEKYHKAKLHFLITEISNVFQNELTLEEKELLTECRQCRNKADHGSFVELMLQLTGEAPGRVIDPKTRKPKELEKDDLIEGVLVIERNRGLEKFTKKTKKGIKVFIKILRSLDQKTKRL